MGGLIYDGKSEDGIMYKSDKNLNLCNEFADSETVEDVGSIVDVPIFTNDLAVTASDVSVQISSIGTAAYSCLTALPVSLLNFNAWLKNNDAIVTWQTAQEENASHFIIQRSTDEITFSNIGNVTAAGNSRVIKSYEYIDQNVTKLNSPQLFTVYRKWI